MITVLQQTIPDTPTCYLNDRGPLKRGSCRPDLDRGQRYALSARLSKRWRDANIFSASWRAKIPL